MLVQKYRLQSEMENLKQGNEEWFKDYIRQVLESDKSYFEKAEYIAYSINQISAKISFITDEIKTLQSIKKALTNSKELALEITASVLKDEYGIDRLEGATTVSSITITPEKSSTKKSIKILDETSLLNQGFVSFSVDEIALQKAIENEDEFESVKDYIEVESVTTTIPQKIKINSKRSVNSTTQVDEILTDEKVA